jgi:hypothetical protein
VMVAPHHDEERSQDVSPWGVELGGDLSGSLDRRPPSDLDLEATSGQLT